MATVFDSPFNRQRLYPLRQREIDFEEDERFGRFDSCDCTSCSYLFLSLVLISVGSVITGLALGNADRHIFNNLHHMWLVGLIFICSGLMVAVNSMLYLRRRSVKLTLLHQRAIFVDLATAQDGQNFTSSQVNRKNGITASTATLPPAYDALIIGGTSIQRSSSTTGIPPPTYDKALLLIGDEKARRAVFEMKISQDRDSQTLCHIAEHTKS